MQRAGVSFRCDFQNIRFIAKADHAHNNSQEATLTASEPMTWLWITQVIKWMEAIINKSGARAQAEHQHSKSVWHKLSTLLVVL